MPWSGKPRWDGNYVGLDEFGPIVGKLFPVVSNYPWLILIEGSPDSYFPIFSTEAQLRETTDRMLGKLGVKLDYVIGRVTSEDMVTVMLDMNVRIMCDPVVVDDHHTKWKEIVREGDVYRFLDPEAK